MAARSDSVADTFADLSTPELEGLNRESIRLMQEARGRREQRVATVLGERRRRLAKAVCAADAAVRATEPYAMGSCPTLERKAYLLSLVALDEAKKFLAAEGLANDVAAKGRR